MKNKKAIKQMAALFLCAAILMNTKNAISATSLEEAEKEKESLKTELQAAEALIDDLKDSRDDIATKVTELDTKLTEISTKLSELSVQLEEKNELINDTSNELKDAKEEEQKQYENMKQRIRFMYENRLTSNYIYALFGADSFIDFLNEVEYIKRLETYDRQMLEEYQKAKEKVSDTKSTLEAEKEELTAMQEEVNDSKEALTVLLDEKKVQLEQIDQNIEVASDSAEAVEAEIAAQEELIEQIRAAEAAKKAKIEAEKERKRLEKEAEEKAKAEAEAASGNTETADGEENTSESGETQAETTGDNTSSEEEDEEEYEETYNGGAFLWPCPSSTRVTSDYGTRISPTAGASSNHKGIDIGAAYGADIIAVADGTVIASTYSSSCGNYVMIDHGGGVYTVYMHASECLVSSGESVTAGQPIARVGSTGISTGNHLHFGVSVNGEYVSPWNYLK